ncbi:hypothetical protein SGRA_0506 [Saprospira grandis str. Lewin]|uniref:Uncharacterized protein n=1 Tax=Saprospira grandis (strain Lewin) TaxID=984262 RepID=H6L9R7_SAPGL|nr:hypothetical protein SGRA_0506 [Saprospira grandis str. Lewin]
MLDSSSVRLNKRFFISIYLIIQYLIFWGCPFRWVETQRKAVSLCELMQNEG